MANVTVRHVVDMVEDILQDIENDNWGEANLLNWYNLSQRKIVKDKADANAVIETVRLAVGTKQAIPSKGISLLDVRRNMGTDGETVGDAVTPGLLPIIRSFDLGWHTATAATPISNFIVDSADKRTWYCYPPSNGAGFVELEFSQVPEAVVFDEAGDWESKLVGVTEDYVHTLVNLILHWAYLKDSDYPGNERRSLTYLNMALMDLGQPAQGQEAA
jgi:hypothetical protein